MENFLKHIPQWFAAAFALIYLSGYLIEFFFYSSWGVFDVQNDALKLKYIQVGLSFFLTFILIGVIAFFHVLGRWRQISEMTATRQPIRYTVAGGMPTLQVGIFLLSILCANLFTPTHFFHRDPSRLPALAALVIVCIGGYAVGTWVIEQILVPLKTPTGGPLEGHALLEPQARQAYYKGIMATLLIIISCALDYFIFKDIWPVFGKLIADQGYFYPMFVTAFFVVLYRLATRMPTSGVISRASYMATVGLYLPVLFYLSVWSYANTIFPYIPYTKGGADYTFAPHMNVIYDHAEKGEKHIDNAILIYDNPDSLYVARAWHGSDACNWRDRDTTPEVFEIPKSTIIRAYVQSLSPGSSNCNLPSVPTKKTVGPLRPNRP